MAIGGSIFVREAHHQAAAAAAEMQPLAAWCSFTQPLFAIDRKHVADAEVKHRKGCNKSMAG